MTVMDGQSVYDLEASVDGSPSKSMQHGVSSLSTNLSELDNLLQELSSAQFAVEVDRRSSGNISNMIHPNSNSHNLPTNSAKHSSAAYELDELMASLSCMTSSNKDKDLVRREDVLYSSPRTSVRSEEGSKFQPAIGGSVDLFLQTGDGSSSDVNLNAMLEDLNKNMTMQGASVVPRGHCAGCAKLIVGQVITALGQLWHPEHFVCAQCKEEIGTQNFFERDGMPYCENDYHILFSPQCAQCHGPILDKCVTALDKTWHPEHFVCYSCGKELGDEGFHEKDGLVFCRTDYFQHFAPKCGMCNKPIVENFITALNQQWHPKCFACFDCHKPFGSSSFFEHEGFPYCETHFHAKRGSLCAYCGKPVSGRCITAMFRKFHPDHFMCTYCQKQLSKGTFKEENDKPYCHSCFSKLFC